MTQDLKNSLKIILSAYKEGKFTEEEVFTLLDTMINTNNSGSSIISYPYPVYPTNPWETGPTWNLKPYVTFTTNTLDINNKDNGQFKTNVTG